MQKKTIRSFAAGTCAACILCGSVYLASNALHNRDDATQAAVLEQATATSEPAVSITQTPSVTENPKAVITNPTPAAADPPSLSQYLGKLYCDGCGRHCCLLSPRCLTGSREAKTATTEYYETYGA